MGTRLGRALLVRWTAALIVVAGACVLSVHYLDQPVAAAAAAKFGFPRPDLLSYPWLTLALMFAVLVIAERTAEGRSISRMSRALALSGFALAWGVCTTEFLLKPLFGRVPPSDWFVHGTTVFRWLSRADDASFPSGHAVQMAAVATVFWDAYPQWRWVYAGATLVLSMALVVGNWHYLSDVIAGLFVGVTAGLIVQALWNGIGKSTGNSSSG
jgi:membrane-associated phospholipid phosphatase